MYMVGFVQVELLFQMLRYTPSSFQKLKVTIISLTLAFSKDNIDLYERFKSQINFFQQSFNDLTWLENCSIVSSGSCSAHLKAAMLSNCKSRRRFLEIILKRVVSISSHFSFIVIAFCTASHVSSKIGTLATYI